MNVERLKDGVFRIDLGATDWSDLVSRLNQAWPIVAQAAEEFVRAKPGWKWDRLRAYVRFDSDFIWFAPDPAEPRRNVFVAGVEMACLEALYYKLPRGEPAAFDRAHEEMARRVFHALRQSALLPDVRESLAALQRLRPHAITFVEYDDLETERTLVDAAELSSTG